MRKHAETLHANKVCKLAIVVFISTLPFSKSKFVVHFPNVICTKTRSCASLLFIWKWITSKLSFIWLEKNGNAFSPWGPVFPTGPLFRGSIFISSRVRVRIRDRFLDDAFFNEETPIYANEGINFGKSLSIYIFNATSLCILFFIDNFSCYLFGTSQNTLKKCNCNFRSLPAQLAVWVEN